MNIDTHCRQRVITTLAAVLFLGVALRTAWMGDDAYITFRTIDNLTHGLGLRWNVADRVQVFTHPLWMFLVSSVYFFTEEAYYTVLFLSIGVSLAALILFLRAVACPGYGALLGATVLILSKAYMDYSTSGLENPLTHLLLVLFIWHLFKGQENLKGLFVLAGIAALGALNRLDTILLYIPAVVAAWWKLPKVKGSLILLISGTPLIGWLVFSLIYYGFPFPNTAYAKLGTGISHSSIAHQGICYLMNSACVDPLTLLVTGTGLLLGLVRGRQGDRVVSLGVALYLLYIIRVGGDFMSGRFFTAPLLCSLAVLVHYRTSFWREWLPTYTLLLLVGLSSPLCPVRTGSDYGDQAPVMDNGITDERQFYYYWTGLSKHDPTNPVMQHWWGRLGDEVRREGKLFQHDMAGVGFFGYFGGPGIHIMDLHALSEPLLARLESNEMVDWRIGHIVRDVPWGYRKTLETGINQIVDPSLALFYDKLSLITRGPVFDRKRLWTVLQMNLGRYDYLIEEYQQHRVIHVTEDQVSHPVPDGTRWDDPAVWIIPHQALEVELKNTCHSDEVAISLDRDDTYRIDFMLGDVRIAETTLEADLSGAQGMLSRTITVPVSAQDLGYDAMRVIPRKGDERYAIGHLLLEITHSSIRNEGP